MSNRLKARIGAEALRQQIEARIATGVWSAGSRLPTERSLATDFGIGRNTVRAVLADLEHDGRIERHVGRGTFVRPVSSEQDGAPGTDSANAAALPFDIRNVNPTEVMEARLLIEPQLARLIVARASEREMEALNEIVRQGATADGMAAFEYWDNELHRALAAASKNQYLIGIVDGIHKVRQSKAWGALRRRGLTEERQRHYQSDHEEIVRALTSRDPEAAQKAISDHLRNVHSNLLID